MGPALATCMQPSSVAIHRRYHTTSSCVTMKNDAGEAESEHIARVNLLVDEYKSSNLKTARFQNGVLASHLTKSGESIRGKTQPARYPLYMSNNRLFIQDAYHKILASSQILPSLKCEILLSARAIEEIARKTAISGESAHALCQKLCAIIPAIAKSDTSADALIQHLPALWYFHKQNGLYFSAVQGLRRVSNTLGQNCSYRALRAALLTNFPSSWVAHCSPAVLAHATNYRLIISLKNHTVYSIDWGAVVTHAAQIIEEEFQQSVARLAAGAVLSRKIPLEAFQGVLQRVMPHYPACMPKDFDIRTFMESNYSHRFNISTEENGQVVIAPAGACSADSFEAQAIQFLRKANAQPASWKNFEEMCASFATKDGKALKPTDYGAGGWIDLLRACPHLEFTVNVAVREKTQK